VKAGDLMQPNFVDRGLKARPETDVFLVRPAHGS